MQFGFIGCKGSIVVVVSPLTALMVDQKQKFLLRGISVEFVGQCQSDEAAVLSVIKGEIQLVYISPESLLCIRSYRAMLQNARYQEKLVAFVVDEAHCIKLG